MDSPDLESRKDSNQTADDDVNRHGVAVLEPEQPRRYDKHKTGGKLEPFFPDSECRERGNRQYSDDDSDD